MEKVELIRVNAPVITLPPVTIGMDAPGRVPLPGYSLSNLLLESGGNLLLESGGGILIK